MAPVLDCAENMGNPWDKRGSFLTHLLRSVGKLSLGAEFGEGEEGGRDAHLGSRAES